jgi:hypothetical protein
MRIISTCFLVATASLALSPSSEDLHSRYGPPYGESFIARPGISLSVEYGSDHRACQARLFPPQSLLTHQELETPLMRSEAVSEVIEEVAPTAMRGKEINSAIVQSGCNVAAFTDYENVSIMRATHECDPGSPDRDASTTIIFKRDICPKPKPPITVTQPATPN